MTTKRKHSQDSESSHDSDKSGYKFDEEGGIHIDEIYIPPPPRPPGTIEVTGPRLIITKIVNTNFKSYGGVQVLGLFHKNFNAIVGPNGSGKSNVIDALLFIFGCRATKIRTKKIADLIHRSNQYNNCQFCSVAVHFAKIVDKEDDSDAFELVENSEFVVSRTAHKDGSSYYTVDDNKVQYKELASLFRKHGIDLDHNRFLILQGEVEQISLMKPKAPNEHETGMLEYLEDIIGTTRFKEPLTRIDEKIEVLSELRLEKFNRVKLLEIEKNELEKPMLEAVKFLELENEVTKKKNFLLQRQIKQLDIKISQNNQKKAVLTEMENEMNESLQSLIEEKNTKEAAFSEKNKKYESLMKRKEDLTEAFDTANNRDETLQVDFRNINQRRKKVIELLKEEKIKLENLEKVPALNKQKIEEYEGREVQLSLECEKLQIQKENMFASIRKETLSLQEKKEKIQTELVDLKHIVDEKKSDFNLAQSKLKIFMSNEENELRHLETLKTSYESNKQKLLEHTKSTKEIKQQLPVLEKQYKDTIANLDRVKIEEAKVINDIKVHRSQVEETRLAMQTSRSKGRVLDSLTQLKTEGKLPGLFGRLGDLGGIDEKYDIAISTACGPLDNIVVDRVDTAQWCIEFLKTHNIGRATFIVLEKQEHLRHLSNTRINTPENVPRLYDLIKVEDDRIRPAFYYALRDTLVANNVDQATRIAYGAKRYRVVTLKGDLIEMSGTMSGGGRNVSKGRMGQSITVQNQIMSPQKIKNMELQLTQLEEKARELHKKQIMFEDTIKKLQPELRTLKTNLEKFTIELQSLHQQQPNLEKQLKIQEKKVKTSCADPAQVKQLQLVIDSKKEEYEKANSNSEVLQKQVIEITKEINDKIEMKMKPINSKLKESTTMLEKLQAELVKLRVAIKTSERNAKKSQDKINSLEEEKTDAETKLHAIQAERKTIEKDAAKLMEIIEKITEELALVQDFSDEQKQISDINKKLNILKSDKIELDQKINEINKMNENAQNTIKKLKPMLSQLHLQKIPQKETEELRVYTEDELIETDTKRMEIELKREEEELSNAKPNLNAIKEYNEKEVHYIERVNELEEITLKRKQMRNFREELRKKRQEEFHAGFNLISIKLKEIYQLITLGGDAELEMVDCYDPFAEGVVLNVRPPKKSWKNITNLSGGEKTLSSVALVFALHYYKPSPLYFMDEIDAALDFKNVSIVGNYIKERTKNAQFIIISLRSNMFELANHLVGIYKTYDITKSVTVCPEQHITKTVNENRYCSQLPPSNPNILVNTSQESASLFASQNSNATINTKKDSAQESMDVDNM